MGPLSQPKGADEKNNRGPYYPPLHKNPAVFNLYSVLGGAVREKVLSEKNPQNSWRDIPLISPL